ncbi:MAG: hypothetical protein OEQ25_02415 [Gammaproteobacteria bacterium]|nr:hypothetical protein [Gammaproteobacteria bacterium]
MPTYIYESMPTDGRAPERFEMFQRMTETPLTEHPQTGDPVRRIVTGGLGIMGKPIRRSTVVDKTLAAATPCGCSKSALAAMAAAKLPLEKRPRPQTCSHSHGQGHGHGRPGHKHNH